MRRAKEEELGIYSKAKNEQRNYERYGSFNVALGTPMYRSGKTLVALGDTREAERSAIYHVALEDTEGPSARLVFM